MKRGKGRKVPLNLSIDPEVKRLMKIQCAKDVTDVSTVTENLYIEFLADKKKEGRPHLDHHRRFEVGAKTP